MIQEIAFSKVARARRLTKEGRKHWGGFLVQFAWDWFCTVTFRRNVSQEMAWQVCHSFLCRIENASDTPMGWFAVEGRGNLNQRLHFHLLLAGVQHLDAREYKRIWHGLAGQAVIYDYKKHLGAAHYCAAHIDEPGLEYHFSDNLAIFRSGPRMDDTQNDAKECDPIIHQREKQWKLTAQVEAKMRVHHPHSGSEDDNDVAEYNERDKGQAEEVTPRGGADLSTRWKHSCKDTSMRTRISREDIVKHDEKLREQWAATKKAVGDARMATISFGRLCDQARSLELHKHVHKPGSRKGYVSFEEYIFDLTDGEVSRSKLYQSIDLFQLTQGPHSITNEDLAEMPIQNACLLRRLSPERRTPDIVEAAKRTSKREFPAKLQARLNEYLPPSEQRTPRVDFFCKLHPTVADKLDETIERFSHLPVVRDGDRVLTLREKAIFAICNAAEQFASEDLATLEREHPKTSQAEDVEHHAFERRGHRIY